MLSRNSYILRDTLLSFFPHVVSILKIGNLCSPGGTKIKLPLSLYTFCFFEIEMPSPFAPSHTPPGLYLSEMVRPMGL